MAPQALLFHSPLPHPPRPLTRRTSTSSTSASPSHHDPAAALIADLVLGLACDAPLASFCAAVQRRGFGRKHPLAAAQG